MLADSQNLLGTSKTEGGMNGTGDREGYTAIKARLGYRDQPLAPDLFDRALQALYAWHRELTGGRQRRADVGPFRGSADEEGLADEWLRERERLWARRGRINRFGLLKPLPLAGPVGLPRLRRCFPQLSRAELLSLRAGFPEPNGELQDPSLRDARTLPRPPKGRRQI